VTGSLFQCTAADLATKNPDTLSPDLSVGEAHEWLATNEYDVAPVVTDAGPQGYADIEVLSDAPSEATLESHLSTISLSNIIGSDAAFGDVLTALYETPRYFLGGRNEVTGILTRADLNKSPAYIHLFDRLSTLEERLTELIIKQEIDWKTTVSFDDDTIKAIGKRYQRAQQANIDLAEIHYAQFSTLTRIVSESESCWRACGFSSPGSASRQLNELRKLRNAVAHSNLVLETTSDGVLEQGRTVSDLEQIYRTLQQCLAELG
jgi:CBS domain-containing protein